MKRRRGLRAVLRRDSLFGNLASVFCNVKFEVQTFLGTIGTFEAAT